MHIYLSFACISINLTWMTFQADGTFHCTACLWNQEMRSIYFLGCCMMMGREQWLGLAS